MFAESEKNNAFRLDLQLFSIRCISGSNACFEPQEGQLQTQQLKLQILGCQI
jgi:hypothetical protein